MIFSIFRFFLYAQISYFQILSDHKSMGILCMNPYALFCAPGSHIYAFKTTEHAFKTSLVLKVRVLSMFCEIDRTPEVCYCGALCCSERACAGHFFRLRHSKLGF